MPADDRGFVRDVLPKELASFPDLDLPKSVRHPAGFSVSGAPVGTFLRSALLVAGQKALGTRFADSSFYESVERDLAFGIMRSHFHHGYPKGTRCCAQCTLARNDRPVFGAFLGHNLVGFVGLRREIPRKLAHKAYIWGMYVDPARRRDGIGRLLVAEALSSARSELQVRQVNLGVNARNDAAIALYEAMGFVTYGRESCFMLIDGVAQDEIHMVRVLG